MLQSRFGVPQSGKLPSRKAKDFTTSIMSTASVVTMPTKTVLLTDVDQRQIEKIRQRNERFTQKLISD